MAKRTKRTPRNGNGRTLEWMAAQVAYRDAWYAILLERMESYLRDPKRQERINRAFREVLEDILTDLPK